MVESDPEAKGRQALDMLRDHVTNQHRVGHGSKESSNLTGKHCRCGVEPMKGLA